MEASRRPATARACDEARLLASLALDGQLDELGRLHLRRHLDSCPDCALAIEGMQAVSEFLRREPLLRFRCRLPGGRLAPSCSSGPVRYWTGAAVAVAALVLATGALPGRGDPQAPAAPAVVVTPLALPIGQRSAMDDFAPPARTS